MAQKIVRQNSGNVSSTSLVITNGEIAVYEQAPQLIPVPGAQGAQGTQGAQGCQGSAGGAQGAQGQQGERGESSHILLDAGFPETIYESGLKINCGGVV
jgi:hypothetical protein